MSKKRANNRRKKKEDRHPYEHYPTPQVVCDWTVKNMLPKRWFPIRVLDPGCGFGPYGKAIRHLWPHADIELIGIDVCPEFNPPPGIYNHVIHDDFLRWAVNNPQEKFHVILGNPWYEKVEQMIPVALNLLDPDWGVMCLLLALEFLGGQARRKSMWKGQTPLLTTAISSTRINFKGEEGTGDMRNHANYLWGPRRLANRFPPISWFDYLDGTVDVRDDNPLPHFNHQMELFPCLEYPSTASVT